MRETGIKRRPVTGKFSLDFVQSIPYDPMHSLLLGWVKLVTTLVLGQHPKQADVNCPFFSTKVRKFELMRPSMPVYKVVRHLGGDRHLRLNTYQTLKQRTTRVWLSTMALLYSADGTSTND